MALAIFALSDGGMITFFSVPAPGGCWHDASQTHDTLITMRTRWPKAQGPGPIKMPWTRDGPGIAQHFNDIHLENSYNVSSRHKRYCKSNLPKTMGKTLRNRHAAPNAPAMADTAKVRSEPLLLEIAWEVCNRVGGIYTVLQSKVPSMLSQWGNRYCLVGPWDAKTAAVEFEEAPLIGAVGQAVKQLQAMGIGAHYGRWLVGGRPHVVLINYLDVFPKLHEIKYLLWKDHHIQLPGDDPLINNVVAFGHVCSQLLHLLAQAESARRTIIAHFHEWMAGSAIPTLGKTKWPGTIVFTTHATQLGRYLAMHDDQFYQHLPFYDPQTQATRYQVQAQHGIERAAAHGASVFTTVSDVTGIECKHLLGREPDMLLPNGLNIKRFTALHEFQNLHRACKDKIHAFTMGHFFPSYSFDLENTLYFFTSGRFEYRNKGMDVTLDSLVKLNDKMKRLGSDKTVIAFIITQRPIHSIHVDALHSRAMLDKIRTAAQAIGQDIGEKLFHAAAQGHIADLNGLVDDHWKLSLRRSIHAWKRDLPPAIVTHDLVDNTDDPVLNQLRTSGLWNQKENPVKVIYHPDFINPSNPLFGLEYEQFVRGCHMGIFPSFYEPWGYTPLESIALGVPAITSDLSGFGSYIKQLLPNHEERGLYVLKRRQQSFQQSAQRLADRLYDFTLLDQRGRITLRSSVESFSDHFDWQNLAQCYHEAHRLALDRV